VDEGVDDVESDMTQPAKVQEPSMEEILASIRRIIADDEAKPAAAEPAPAPQAVRPEPPKPVATAPKPAMTNIPPSALPAAQAAVAKAAAPQPAPPMPAPAASNSQDDIDAMLAGLDAATTEEEIRPAPPELDVFELTDEMALPDPDPEPAPTFQHVEPEDDLEFAEAVAASTARPRSAMFDPPSYDPAPAPQPQFLSHTTASAVESAFNSLANTVLSNNARTLEDLVKEMLRPMLKSWLDDNLPGLVERIVKAEIERVSRGGR
jgi:cell pole-organizing protein PopZ